MSWVRKIEKVDTSFAGTSTSVLLTEVGGSGYDGYLIPFVTFAFNGVSTDIISPLFVDVYFSGTPGSVSINFQRGEAEGTAYVTAYVVEIDTNEVDVQYKSFSITSSSTDSTTSITSVTEAKTFLVAYYRWAYTGAEYYYRSITRTRLLNPTTVDHKRDNTGGDVDGHFWTVEDLGSNFSVQHSSLDIIDPATSDEATITAVDMTKSFVISSYYNEYGDRDTRYAGVSSWLKDSTTVRIEQELNASFPADSHAAAQVITLEDEDAYVQRNHQIWAGGDTIKQGSLSPEVELDYSIPWIPTLTSMQWNDTDADNAVFFMTYFNSSTQIEVTRAASGAGADVYWEAIQFRGAPSGFFAGYVTEQPTPASPETALTTATVRAYRRDTGELMAETTSSGVGGYYYLETTYSGIHYLICLDPSGGETYNLLGYDLVYPTTFSG